MYVSFIIHAIFIKCILHDGSGIRDYSDNHPKGGMVHYHCSVKTCPPVISKVIGFLLLSSDLFAMFVTSRLFLRF